MSNKSSAFRSCFLAFLMLALLPCAQAYGQETVDNGCTDVNGARFSNCSRLDKNGGRVTIKATDCGNQDSTLINCPPAQPGATPNPALYGSVAENNATCRTIHNTDTKDYFVPWKTAQEWGSFLAFVQGAGAGLGLSISPCCTPKVGTVCANQLYNGTLIGPDGIPVRDPVTNVDIQLGKRLLGKRGGVVADYGAHDDVSNTLDASALLGDDTINYKVTYVCDNGGNWVKTFEEGSCTPLDGACGPSVPATGVTPENLAALEQQKLLCVDGSVMRNLNDYGTYWRWDCEGTPTRATATCTVANSTTNSGTPQCGTANFGRLVSMPSTSAQLCAGGTPTAIGGTGTEASPWNWTCNGSGSAYTSCLAYRDGTQLNGVCGSSNGYVATDSSWSPGTGSSVCDNGTQLTAAGVVSISGGWEWNCAGENGGADQYCSASFPSVIGACGFANDTAGTTPPDPANLPSLCTRGTPSAITHGSDYALGRTAWHWNCEATKPCNGDYHCACEKIDVSLPQTPHCGPAAYGTITGLYTATNPPRGGFCELGSAIIGVPVWDAAQLRWEWQCQGLSGGTTRNCTTSTALKNGACNYGLSFVVTPSIPLPANACQWSQAAINKTISGATYTYQCPGVNGGTTANCAASYDAAGIVGVCGYPQGQLLSTGTAPATGTLCSSGTPINQGFNSTQNRRYEWDCRGSSTAFVYCNVYVGAQQGVCGAANGTQQSSQPSGGALCSYGTASAVTSASSVWYWTCQGMAGTAPKACNATSSGGSGSGTNGACGSANGSQTSVTPTSNLCNVGTATSVTGIGPWTWSCLGSSGGTTAACIATRPAGAGPGACGAADGTTIPSRPNINLCTSGNPTSVAGSGPWTWDCIGTTTASCSAELCDACTGDLAGVAKSDVVAQQFINYGGGTCRVSGTVNWTEIDRLSSNNGVQNLTLGNTASGLDFTKAAVPGAAPSNYCPPCYRRAKTISGNFTVQKDGTCGGSSLNDGAPATIAIDSVLIR